MKIKFVGAIDHITGSCCWLKYDQTGTQFLVDCGMYQGMLAERLNMVEFPFDPAEISFVLLTHAHIDHCGLIPKLYREGFNGKVYATTATAKMAEISLRDSVKINTNKNLPIYTESHVDKINFVKVDEDETISFVDEKTQRFFWGARIWVDTNISVEFLRSSHILGAASITVHWKDKEGELINMCFSGDIGNNIKKNSYLPLMKPNQYPFPKTKYLLVESTYGGISRDEKFKSQENRQTELWRIIEKTRENEGKLLIPVFAVHRPQEILIDLVATLKKYAGGAGDTRILCHSPMIAKNSKVYFEELNRSNKKRDGTNGMLYRKENILDYVKESDDFFKFLFQNYYYKFMGDSKIEIVSKRPEEYNEYDIIMAASGMCNAGPIVGYLEEYENDPRNTILLTGYQATEEGKKLKDRITQPTEGRARVESMSSYYSGHADQDVLLDYIFNVDGIACDKDIKPATVFINHGGNLESKEKLKLRIEEKSKEQCRQRPIQEVKIAEKSEQWFNLHSGEFEEITITDLMREIHIIQRKLRKQSRLLANSAIENKEL